MRWRVRFGYDGSRFDGWAQQPGRRTVEGELLRGLTDARVVPAARGHLDVASRTDKGVSARANALAIESGLAAGPLLRVLNGVSSDVWFMAAAPFPDPARIRAATGRIYRYYEAPAGYDLSLYRAAAATLTGEVDVRSLGRAVPAGRPVWRRVRRMAVRTGRDGWEVEVEAPSFVWGMVRKMVGSCREVAAGRLPLERLGQAARGEVRLTLPMADPGALVLWDVQYAEPWAFHWRGPNRHQQRQAEAVRGSLRARQALWSGWTEAEAAGRVG